MARSQVEAIKKFGKYKPGDIFEMHERDARIYRRAGAVRDYVPPRRAKPSVDPAAVRAEPSAGSAEEGGGSAPSDQPPQPAAQEPGLYGRRDMRPEC